MSLHNIKLVFLREVRDQLRDRRTLFMIAILPILLYPLLGIGMVQMALLFSEQPRTVVVLNADDLPHGGNLELLETREGKIGFNPNWFRIPQDVDKLSVVTERSADSAKREKLETAAKMQAAVGRAQIIDTQLKERLQLDEELEKLEKQTPLPQTQIDEINEKIEAVNDKLATLFKNSGIDVLMIVPDRFDESVKKADDIVRASGGKPDKEAIGDYPGVTLVFNRADEKSMLANRRVEKAIERWEEKLRERRFSASTLHEKIATPANLKTVDLAEDKEVAANIWSKIFPALLIIMAVTGAFYPSIDLAAGEKERGTMETLLISPARRSEIVMGKFLTVFAFSGITALLNLLSLGLTGRYMASMGAGGAFKKLGDLSLPGFGEIMWVLVMLLPLAALFSALCFALATFARSTKEGQYYLTPLLMVTMGLTIFCLSPGISMQPFYCVLPVVGPGLLLREILATGSSPEVLSYAFPVLAASVAWSLLAIWWAIEQFGREEVLFREAERVDLKLWFRHMLREKEPLPTGGEAGLCVVLILILSFAMMRFAGGATDQVGMLKMTIVHQLVVIACPALFMGLLLTTNWRGTFRLGKPSRVMVLLAIGLPFVLHPLEVMMQDWLRWFFPKLPAGVEKMMGGMSSESVPLWLAFVAIALTPGICEEIAFRGFILKGLERGRKVALAIVLSSLAFGLVHMIPQQVFNATLVGLIIGLIAVRSGSLWPCIIFHVVHNSIGLWHYWISQDAWTAGVFDPVARWFVTDSPRGLLYDWPTLLVSIAATFVAVRWLIRYGTSPREQSDAVPSLADSQAPA